MGNYTPLSDHETDPDEEDQHEYDDYDDYDDCRSAREKEISDRLDMGRNDAGEWIGFC